MGSCSCASSCRYYGNCCRDYNYYCPSSTASSTTQDLGTNSTPQPSCRYNCGNHMGSCSCASSCRYYGNCCRDYNYYCPSSTASSTTQDLGTNSTPQPSCRYNCGNHMGSCSCASSCRYYGNCCRDYNYYCQNSTTGPTPPTTGNSCEKYLSHSGTFTSPNHPGYYYSNSYCTWQLRVQNDQKVFLSFRFMELENCCSCDYVAVYDGPSVGSPLLGKLCNKTVTSFRSSSNYLTVLFRTDSSVVARGFKAEFTSSLPANSGFKKRKEE
eukprot:XP_011619151.1 PREDICTED: deleted in malignant brain tumors 1 protein-like [Takifugu rubripes]